MTAKTDQPYLDPYLQAAKRHGAALESLLWASSRTQSLRFDAMHRLADMKGRSILDVGCGRADLLDFLLARQVLPADYIGIEAVPTLAEAARAKESLGVPFTLIEADFVREPARMFVGADVVAFSGSLNTLGDADFYATLARALDATADALVFNFLSSPLLAGSSYLSWRRPDEVMSFLQQRAGRIQMKADYLPGDCTIAAWRA